jgi:hypothetical protein
VFLLHRNEVRLHLPSLKEWLNYIQLQLLSGTGTQSIGHDGREAVSESGWQKAGLFCKTDVRNESFKQHGTDNFNLI